MKKKSNTCHTNLMTNIKAFIVAFFVFILAIIPTIFGGLNYNSNNRNLIDRGPKNAVSNTSYYPTTGNTTISFLANRAVPTKPSNGYAYENIGNQYWYFISTKTVTFTVQGASSASLGTGGQLYYVNSNGTTTSNYVYNNDTVTVSSSYVNSSTGAFTLATKGSTLIKLHFVFMPSKTFTVKYGSGSEQTSMTSTTRTNKSSVTIYNKVPYVGYDGSYKTLMKDGSATYSSEGTHTVTVYSPSVNSSGRVVVNSTTKTLIIDHTNPTLTIKNSDGTSCSCTGDTHNHPVKVDFNDNIDDLSSKYPDFVINSSYESGTVSSIESKIYDTIGSYWVYLEDNTGNWLDESFTITDNTSPTISVKANGSEISSGTKTSHSVTVTGSDYYSTTLSKTYGGTTTTVSSSTDTVSADGEYTYYVKDANGNKSSSVSFTIDKTAPTVSMYASDGTQISDGDTTSKYVYFNVSDTNSISSTTITNGSSSYDWSSLASSSAKIYYPANESPDTSTHLYSNENEIIDYIYNLEVAKVTTQIYSSSLSSLVYSGDKSNVYKGGTVYRYTNSSTGYDVVYASLTNAQSHLKDSIIKNNSKYYKDTNKTLFTHEGTWTITCTDEVGNSTSRNFTIDKTAPTGTLSGVTNGGVTNGRVTFTWTESGATATYTKNGGSKTSFSSSKVFSETGVYVITLKDLYNNERTYSFEIDATAPTGTLTNVSNGGTTNKDVSFSWTEGNATAKLDNSSYSKGTAIKSEGTHTIVLTDINGNSTTYTFTIDKTAPSFTVNPSTLQNGGSLNSSISISWNEANCTTTIKKNGSTFTPTINTANSTNTIVLSSEGVYTFKITDAYGNSTEAISLEIDLTAPTGTLTNVSNGGTTNKDVSFSWNEASATATLNGNPYTKNTAITTTGSYTIILTDTNGNSSSYSFSIDKIAPTISVNPSTLQSGGITNSKVSFSWDDSSATATIKKNSSSATAYTSGTIISEEGTYVITVTDPYSNSSSFTFTIDTTPINFTPTTTTTFIGENNLTNGNVTISWNESAKAVYLDGNSYNKGNVISSEGEHEFIIIDSAGNSATYSFTIDKTAPSFTLNEYNIASNGVVLVDSKKDNLKNIYSSNSSSGLSLNWNEDGATATLNGEVYKSGSQILEETTFVFVLTDKAGNEIEFTFSLDFTAYSKNYEYFLKNNYNSQNHWFETYDYKFDQNSNSYKKDKTYSFENYNNAYTYAINREKAIVETGTFNGSTIWSSTYNMYVDKYETVSAYSGLTYYIYKDLAGQVYAYFSQESLDSAISYYVDNSLSEKWLPSTPADSFIGEDLSLDAIYIKGSSFGFNYKPTDVTLYVNDRLSPISYNTTFTTEGSYHVTEIDSAGNELSYTIILDNSLPKFVVTDINGVALPSIQNSFATQTEIRCTQQIILKAIDDYDENCVIYINDTPYIYSNNSNGFVFSETGTYTIYAIDCSNNKTKTITFYLSLEEISHRFEDIYSEDESLAGFDFEISLNNGINKINTINVLIYTEKDGTKSVTRDANNQLISSETLFYHFAESGIYTINVTDIFGRSYTYTHEIQRDKPQGSLFMIDGTTITPLQNGTVLVDSDNKIIKNTPSVTNKAVYLTWNDSTCKAYMIYTDGSKVSYSSGTRISTSGSYLIALENDDEKITYFSFIIDKTAPIGNFFIAETDVILTNNSYINKSIYFSWDEEDCTATLNGNPYTKNSVISNDNSYTIILTDKAGNSASYTVYLKTTPPKVTISSTAGNYNSGGYANKNVTFSWTESGCYYYLDGVLYESGKSITVRTEGVHVLQIHDRYGNSATYSINLDRTAPIGSLNTSSIFVGNDYLTNGDVSFSWTEETAIVLLNGEEYTKNSLITKEGLFTIEITDLAGNSTIYSFIIDKTAPEGTLTGVKNEGITNSSASFTWTEIGLSCTLDGNSYTKGNIIKSEGKHVIVLTDKAGNSTTYTFTIDKTAEEGILTGVINGGITNGVVSFSFDESKATATLNGIDYISETEIYADNSYTIILTDIAGNTSTYTFTIKTDLPKLTLSGVTNGGTTNQNVTISWDAKDYIVTYSVNDGNSSSYTKNDILKSEGKYNVSVSDSAGNFATYSFTIDKTPVNITLNTTSSFVGSNNLTNGDVTVSWDDINAIGYINGIIYTQNTLIQLEGTYNIIIYDNSNNEKSISFTIDKTAPEGTLSGVKNGEITNKDVSFSWTESGVSATLNGVRYEKGNVIKSEGVHSVILTDKAGNSATYSFTIDKTAPTGVLSGVEDKGITNEVVSFSWSDEATATVNDLEYISGTELYDDNDYVIVLTDSAGNSTTYTFTISKVIPELTLNGVDNGGITNKNVTISWESKDYSVSYQINNNSLVTYTKNSELKSEGTYRIIVTNIAGSSNEYTFIIDKTAEEGILTGVSNNGVTNTTVSFAFDNSKATATLNGEVYESGTQITENNSYTIILTDKAGNTSTYNFDIDTVAPTGILIGVTNDGITNSDVSFTWDENGASATLNGNPYTKNTAITEDGSYIIVLKDKLGNSVEYFFTIFKEAPEGFFNVSINQVINEDVIFTWFDSSYTATLNNLPYESGTVISEDGNFTIILTNSLGTSSKWTFTIDKTPITGELFGVEDSGITNNDVSFVVTDPDAIITLNGENYRSGSPITQDGYYIICVTDKANNSTFYTFTIDKTAPTGTLSGVTNDGETNTDVSFYWSEDGATATLNGEVYESGTQISESGSYEITLKDVLGNSVTYSFTIDKIAPTGTLDGVEHGGITNSNVSFTWTESGVSATLNGVRYEKGTTIKGEQDHEIKLSDKLGNYTIYSFTIDKTAPTGTLDGVSNNGITNGVVSFSWDENGATATLNGNSYTKGNLISEDNSYTIILTDNVGNSTTYSFTIDTVAPTGTLSGVTNDGITNTNVSFSWNEAECSVTLNGSRYTKNDVIKSEGTHIIVLTDKAGNSTTYSFTIDKTAPEGTLDGVENGENTNKDVSFSWDENGATATLNGESYESGTAITENNSYTIILTDSVGNSTTYTFTIDKIAPTGTLSGVENEGVTNGNVTFSWTESGVSATLNGQAYEKDTVIKASGDHVIVLTDKNGNSTTYTFTIDKTAPTGVLSGVDNGGITNSNVSFSWTESGVSATLNNLPYTSGTIISEEGDFVIILSDSNSNSVTYSFTIDKTAPEIVLSGVENEGKTNTIVTVSWDDSSAKATLNGDPYNKGDRILKSNSYELILTDKAGNKTIVTFSIKREFDSPIESYSINSDSLESLLETLPKSSIQPIKLYFGVDITAIIQKDELDPVQFSSGTVISELGEYKITFTDDFGNTKTIEFKIVEEKVDTNPYLAGNIATITIVSVVTVGLGVSLIFIIKNRLRNPYKFKRKK